MVRVTATGVCALLLSAALGAGACTSLLDIDGYAYVHGGGGGGAGGSDCSPAACPGLDTACGARACVAGSCDFQAVPAGTPCAESGGKICDGEGSCVECLDLADCGIDEVCQGGMCVPDHCTNGMIDAAETDVDCGGPCAPCANGKTCNTYSDCESRFCDKGGSGGAGGAAATGLCAPCAGDNHCLEAPDTWCDGSVNSGSCVDKKVNGDVCAGANECLSGQCPAADGLCCDTACTSTCQACLASKTGGSNGTCALVSGGTDPDGECPDGGAASCAANGTGCTGSSASCNLYPNGQQCAAPSCSAGQATSARYCNGAGTCGGAISTSCGAYVCNGDVCYTSCTQQSHCNSGNYCNGSTCQAKKSNGTGCGVGVECTSGFCVDGVCCNSICTGQCRACSNAKTGGSNGTCLAVSAGTDPDGECPNAPGSCGPNGTGCDGSASDPDCNGSVCFCDEQYPVGGAVLEQCNQTGAQCTLRVTTSSQSCNAICLAGGGSCVLAYNDSPEGSCGMGGALSCSTTGLLSMLCICSRGCGGIGSVSCYTPFQCISGDCQ